MATSCASFFHHHGPFAVTDTHVRIGRGGGFVGAGTAPLFGTIGADLFGGLQHGRVFGLLGVAGSMALLRALG